MNTAAVLADIRAVATAHGIDAIGVAAATVFTGTLADLHERRDAGYSADMAFTYRNPERSTDPGRILEGARSIVVGARSYLRAPDAAPGGGPVGQVARYVWEDHYAALRHGLTQVVGVLEAAGHRGRVVVDDNALVDREAAHRAGLGWYGKNANLLLPGQGSWFVLGSVVTDADLPAAEPLPDGCGSCERCLASCPTDAIVAPGVIDARRCLAWLVQARGTFPHEHRVALGTRIYGCDDCQEVCPPNRLVARRSVAVSVPARRPWVPLLDLLDADDATLLDRYGVWYIADRDPDHLRRNALVALGNSDAHHDPRVAAAIAVHVDAARAMVAAHAVWAAHRLGLDHLVARARGDRRPEVADEVARIDAGLVPRR